MTAKDLVPGNGSQSLIIPGFRYRNAPAAIEWLCSAFGFTKHAVYPGPNHTISHAQLTFGNGMIMLGSVRDGHAGGEMKHPDEISGASTLSVYVVVRDAEAHYARAKAAGATIIREVRDEDYGGRGYACRDLESYPWSFGTYNPWQS
jgi:uncharacterized glyoxalase superfamily protein PhnB